jgi:hypothetical protein
MCLSHPCESEWNEIIVYSGSEAAHAYFFHVHNRNSTTWRKHFQKCISTIFVEMLLRIYCTYPHVRSHIFQQPVTSSSQLCKKCCSVTTRTYPLFHVIFSKVRDFKSKTGGWHFRNFVYCSSAIVARMVSKIFAIFHILIFSKCH